MRRPGQRGVALITAILMVALATVAAVAMATRQQLDIRRTGNLLHGEQAWAYVQSAESWARVVLERDARNSRTDALGEDWATQLSPSLVEGGQVAGRLIDLQGRFNVNNLVNGGKADAKAVQRFKRLLRVLDLDVALADALVDWLDDNINETFPDGAEDNAYLLRQPPYRAANQPLVSLSELRLVKGFDQPTFDKLAPFVSALPQSTALNINTAPAEVLRTLADSLSETDAEALIQARGDDGVADVATLLAEPALAGKTVDAASLTVSSQWFRLVAVSDIGQGRAELTSLIQRVGLDTRVVRRERLAREPVIR